MGKKVTVQAAEYHTTAGKEYNVGDTYQVDEDLVTTLKVQGKAFEVAPKKTKEQAAGPETKDASAPGDAKAAQSAGKKARAPRAARKPKVMKVAEKSQPSEKSAK